MATAANLRPACPGFWQREIRFLYLARARWPECYGARPDWFELELKSVRLRPVKRSAYAHFSTGYPVVP